MRLGMPRPDAPPTPDAYELWPDLYLSVLVASRLLSQWHTGPGGPIGLRYESLPVVLRMLRVPEDDEPVIFEDVRAVERAWLLEHERTRSQR